MARTPASNDAFFREVDDEVRREQMARLGRRWGVLAIALALAALIAFGGWLFWQHRTTERAGTRGEQLTAAMSRISTGNSAGAKAGLTALAATGTEGYAPLAAMLLADTQVQAGKPADAATAFRRIAADETAPQPLRDLATVRATALAFDTTAPAQVIATLKPLAVPGGAWFGSAGEMTGIAQMKLGQPKAAGETFAAVAKDTSVPATVRQRAAQLAGDLGIEVVQPGESGQS